MSNNCATPEPAKGKSKGNATGAKGSSKGKAAGGKGRNGKNSKGEFVGFCSFCGKSGHKEAECWAKERRNSSAPLANVDAAAVDKELGGFDVAGLDFSLVPPAPKPHKTWADIVRKKGPFISTTIVSCSSASKTIAKVLKQLLARRVLQTSQLFQQKIKPPLGEHLEKWLLQRSFVRT